MNTNTTQPVTQAASAGLPAQGVVQPAAGRPDVIHNPAGRPVAKSDALGTTTVPGELYSARTGDLIAEGVKPGDAPRILRYDAPGTYTGSGYEPANKDEKTKTHEPVAPVTHHVPHHHAGSVPHHELKKEEKPIEREHRPSDISGRHEGLAREKPIVQQPHISRTEEGLGTQQSAKPAGLAGEFASVAGPEAFEERERREREIHDSQVQGAKPQVAEGNLTDKPHLGLHQLLEGNLADVSNPERARASVIEEPGFGLQREGGFGSEPGIGKESGFGQQREGGFGSEPGIGKESGFGLQREGGFGSEPGIGKESGFGLQRGGGFGSEPGIGGLGQQGEGGFGSEQIQPGIGARRGGGFGSEPGIGKESGFGQQREGGVGSEPGIGGFGQQGEGGFGSEQIQPGIGARRGGGFGSEPGIGKESGFGQQRDDANRDKIVG